MNDLQKYEEFLASKKAAKEFFSKKKEEIKEKIELLQRRVSVLEEALDVMNATGILAQEEFKAVFERLVTQALQYVFGENYSFEVESTISRGQPEMSMYVVIDGKRHLLKDDELGYGVVDVVSFILRLVCWAIKFPRTRNCFIVDEPLRNLDSSRLVLFGEVLNQLSDMLGIQFIFVTHEKQLAEIADVSYHVEKVDNVSRVSRIEEI